MIQREKSTAEHRRPDGPVRTCIGCRHRELAVELLRMVAVVDGNGAHTVIVDSGGTLPGRGAWLHPVQQCLEAAIRRRAVGRALRIPGSPDITAVIEYVVAPMGSSDGLATPATEQVAKKMSTP